MMRRMTVRGAGCAFLRGPRVLPVLAVTALMGAAVLCGAAVIAPAALAAPGTALHAGTFGPVTPIPTTLWKPAAGAVPATGDYVYLKSDAGDFIGQGGTYLYTRASAVLTVSATGGLLTVGVKGDEWWNGDFQTMTSVTDLEQGYYPGLERYPFNDPTKGGLDWSGDGRGSNTLTGWFAIDSVTYDNGDLTAITLRFELHSEGETPALHGAIHWEADDTTQPPGPVVPVPASLWQPAAGVVPTSGNYVYLESAPGEYVGAGRAYLYTPATAELNVTSGGGDLEVRVNGDEMWEGTFDTMDTVTDIEPGYYPGLELVPGNPAKGCLDWSGDGRGADSGTGWFAVDSVTYTGDTLTALDLRFTLAAGAGKPALHGVVHWDAAATSSQTAATLTLSAPSVCAYHAARLSGTLADVSTQPVAGATVTIRGTTGGPWTTVGTATTDASGHYSFTAAPAAVTGYQVVFTGNDTEAAVVSTPAATLPMVSLSKPSAPTSARAGATITCSCLLKPHHAAGKYAVVFQFQRRVSGHWVTKRTLKAKATNYHGYSKCSVKTRLTVSGAWRVRAVHAADTLNAATSSAWRAIKVT